MAWSFSHYAVHRWWHKLIEGYGTHAAIELKSFAAGEYYHHDIYDHDPYDPSRDVKKNFISFPRRFTTLAVILGSAAYTAGCWLVTDYWLVYGALMFVGSFGSMILDDFVHRRCQHGRVPTTRLGLWLRGYHKIHHQIHNRNYGFLTGIVWDLLLRSYVSPQSVHNQ